MWAKVDMSGASVWFVIGLLLRANLTPVVLFLLMIGLVGLVCRGLARFVLLGLVVAAVAFVLVALAAFELS